MRTSFTVSAVGVIGVGVVGDAVRRYFESQGTQVRLYDPYKRLGSVEEVNEADVVFICVPTPYTPGTGFDASAVESSLALLHPGKIAVIKSTVLPGTTSQLQRDHPDKLVFFNPEFLREKTATEDFLHPDMQVIGCPPEGRFFAQPLMQLLPRAPYEAIVPPESAELIKYAINSFLAIKVIFGNELFDLCSALGADYQNVRAGLAAEPRIGGSHLDVMDSGYRGYGGKCLPKDTMALLDLAGRFNVDLEVLQAAHDVNQRLLDASILELAEKEMVA
jgi:UDPglucose 6-dehydrogenase